MHRTNGCVTSYYVPGAGQVPCANHAGMAREPVESYQKPGQIVRKLKALSDKTGPRGVWMRDAGWRAERAKPKTRLQATLDATASRKIVYDECTVMVRKATR